MCAGDDSDERVSGRLRVKGRDGRLVSGSYLSAALGIPRSWLGSRLVILATMYCKGRKLRKYTFIFCIFI